MHRCCWGLSIQDLMLKKKICVLSNDGLWQVSLSRGERRPGPRRGVAQRTTAKAAGKLCALRESLT